MSNFKSFALFLWSTVQVIHQFVSGKDIFVSLPTGYGKSLCYALLPLVFDSLRSGDSGRSIVVCISPLTALMMDQRQKVQFMGNSSRICGRSPARPMRAVKGRIQLLYISPESLLRNPRGERCSFPMYIRRISWLLSLMKLTALPNGMSFNHSHVLNMGSVTLISVKSNVGRYKATKV